MNGSEKEQWEAGAAFSLLLVSAVAPADVQVNAAKVFKKDTECVCMHIEYVHGT